VKSVAVKDFLEQTIIYPAMEKPDSVLTKEERDILILISLHPGSIHLTNQEISDRLGIPVSRVKTQIHQACRKLGAHNRNEVVFLAMKQGEIKLDELLPLEELVEILSSVDPDELREIASCIRGNHIPKILPEIRVDIIHPTKRHSGILTNRERDVLILVSRGLSNTEIAETLCMSTSAVRTFLNRACSKLGVGRRADAMEAALKLGEISVGEISSREELAFYLAPIGAESIEELADLIEKKRINKQ
jgi:DNA-binding CsgD family transcriptional regulator